MTRLLWRTFLAQFFASESVTSDIQLRRSMIGVLAALLPPGLFLMVQNFPTYELLAAYRPELLEPFLARLGLIFVTYSMVVVGLIAVVVWDALTFDRRDAMVLGPLPIRGRTIIAAKLAALATFLLGTAAAVNMVSAVPFALVTANRFGAQAAVRAFVAHGCATGAAAAFAFGAIVLIRGSVALGARDRAAARIGSLLQFVFVGSLLSLLVVAPAVMGGEGLPFVGAAGARWIPLAWFLGLFEALRSPARAEYGSLAARAIAATAFAVIGAALVSAAGFRQQMRLALAPPPPAGRQGGGRLSRFVARAFAGRNPAARGASEFIVLSLVRNRPQQAPVAICAAIAFAMIVAALSRHTSGATDILRARTAVLWIPFLLAYWLVVGLRSSFFVPSGLKAAWSFRMASPGWAQSHRRAVVAAIAGVVLPPTITVSLLLAAAAGWRLAAWSAVLASAMSVLLAEAAALTIAHVPYTRAYVPGHARLRTRWPLYLLGVYVCAYQPARLALLGSDEALMALLGFLVAAALAVEFAARRRPVNPLPLDDPDDGADEFSSVTVLAIGPDGANPMRRPAA